MVTARPRGSALFSLLLVAVTLLAVISACLAGYLARHYYFDRAQLMLEPVLQSRFAELNRRIPPPAKTRIVMFGDSRIARWRPVPVLAEYEVVWRGIATETTGQMQYRYGADTHDIGASTVVLEAGINDLVAGAAIGKEPLAVDLAFRNLKTMVGASVKANVEVILLTVVAPASPSLFRRPVWSDSIYDAVAELNRRLYSLAGPRVRVLDANRMLCGTSRRLPPQFAHDTLHFTPRAYAALNAELRKFLEGPVRAVQ